MADTVLNRFIGLAAALMIAGCNGSTERLPEISISGETMGTTYNIRLIEPGEDVDENALATLIDDRLAVINSTMSTYDQGSELSVFNASDSTDPFTVSAELCQLIKEALAISARTGGAFDVTVGPLVNLWGFGPNGAVAEPPPDTSIAATMNRVGYDKLQTNCEAPALRKNRADVYVDLSALAKGYAVDEISRLLEASHLQNFLVEIGGELRMRGHNAAGESWAIAVERPVTNARAVQSVVRLTDSAMATSGDYRNYFEFDGKRYSHTIDPRTGWPVTHAAAAVTVVSDSAAQADGLATALLVLGPDDGLSFAAQNDIAAYFLVRTANGIEQQPTGAFAKLLN